MKENLLRNRTVAGGGGGRGGEGGEHAEIALEIQQKDCKNVVITAVVKAR